MSEILKSIKVLILLLIFTVITAYFVGSMFSAPMGNVALIKIKGEIVPEPDLFVDVASSDKIISEIKDANSNPEIKALLVEINSPGGSVVATKEIANALKSVNKTKVCWLRDIAASGAYWIASTCDYIVADEFTITGSIGVTASYLEFSGLFEKYGINYVRLVSGEEKDIGTPFREPTQKELKDLKSIIDEMHIAFINEIAQNRNLSVDYVSEIADGSIFTGKQAKELGLVDILGSRSEALQIIKQDANLTEIEILEYEEKFSFGDLLSGFLSKQMLNLMLSNKLEIKAV